MSRSRSSSLVACILIRQAVVIRQTLFIFFFFISFFYSYHPRKVKGQRKWQRGGFRNGSMTYSTAFQTLPTSRAPTNFPFPLFFFWFTNAFFGFQYFFEPYFPTRIDSMENVGVRQTLCQWWRSFCLVRHSSYRWKSIPTILMTSFWMVCFGCVEISNRTQSDV